MLDRVMQQLFEIKELSLYSYRKKIYHVVR
jgi:hypothetical protein